MEKSIRDVLEEEIAITENEIRNSLQKFHDKTGMIPKSVRFELIDVAAMDDKRRKVYHVSRVDLTSST